MLFATLDPTLRALDLPHGARVILSDTVGFISDLPTMLVAAFRATLEEVVEADVLLHVHDISHEDAQAQSQDVETVLAQLGIAPDKGANVIEVWNKIDRLPTDRLAEAASRAASGPAGATGRRPILVSAVTRQGLDVLLAEIEARVAERRVVLGLELDAADGAGISWLHRNAEVLEKDFTSDGRVTATVRVDPTNAAAVRARFAPG
jgi:GTPase